MALQIFGVVAAFVGLTAGIVTINEFRISRRLRRITTFPIKISRAVSFSQYRNALKNCADQISASSHLPQVVVGVQYGGMPAASDVAKFCHADLRRVRTILSGEDPPICESVELEFDPKVLTDKHVLVVDNCIHTGTTLRKVVEAIPSHAASVHSLVAHKNDSGHVANVYEATYYLFESKKKLDHLLR